MGRKALEADHGRARGVRPEGPTPQISLRIGATDLDRLEAEATRRGIDRSLAVRQAIAEWIDHDEAATA